MEEQYYNSTMLNRYLLGQLSQAEQELFEESFFSDNDLFIEVLDAKDQLISDYLNGRLSPDNRGRFERHFLTLPECRRELELAHLLNQPLARQHLHRPPQPDGATVSWWQNIFDGLRIHRPLAGLAATAVLVIGLFSFWWMSQTSTGSNQPSIATNKNPGPAVISCLLKPSLTRSAGRAGSEGEIPTVKIDSGTQIVELVMETTAPIYPGYRANVRRENEIAIEFMADDKLKAETTEGGKPVVIVKVPASKLLVNDYQVTLDGIGADNSAKTIGTYHFKVREQ